MPLAVLWSTTIIFPLLMLGGAFFPFEAMPEWMASIGRRIPNGWALERLKDVLFARASMPQLAMGLAAVGAAGFVLWRACLARMRGAFGSGA